MFTLLNFVLCGSAAVQPYIHLSFRDVNLPEPIFFAYGSSLAFSLLCLLYASSMRLLSFKGQTEWKRGRLCSNVLLVGGCDFVIVE